MIEYKTSDVGDFFIGQNTCNGFVWMTDAFAEKKLERLYIIKGAAGTGKSTLMRRVSDIAEKNGSKGKKYMCSSDAASLDGVTLNGKVAIIDGTAPHTTDMKYPGAKSTLVDLSVFWNEEALKKSADLIVMHTEEKQKMFAEASKYIRSAGLLYESAARSIGESFDTVKCGKSVDRLIANLKIGKANGRVIQAATRSVGMKGAVRLRSLERKAETIFKVKGNGPSSDIYMNTLLEKLSKTGADTVYSTDPVTGGINEVYLAETRILFTVNDVGCEKEINTQRFIDKEKNSQVRSSVRLAEKIASSCIDEAISFLKKAGEHHFALEAIYSSSMDFEGLGEYTDALTRKIMCEVS